MSFHITSDGRSVVPLVAAAKQLPFQESQVHPVISAKTNETVHYFQSATTSDCSAACDAAWQAFAHGLEGNTPWKIAGVEQRRTLLERVANLLLEREEEFIRVQQLETSSGLLWSRHNVRTTAKYVQEIASAVSSIKGTIPPNDKPGTMAFVFKEAIGPVLIIPPWNAALNLCTRALAAAIGAGCTAVLKASELCPYTHSLIADVFTAAGAPPGVINFLCAARPDASEVTEYIIANKHIRKIDFIGSPGVGKIITATAARYLKPVLLELGGKCPAIVLDDADLQKAAERCARGALMHHGQICFSTERIIVQRKVAEPFTKALVAAVQALEAQDFAGTAVSEGIASHALEVLQEAKSKGQQFIVGDAAYRSGHPNSLVPAIVAIDPATNPDDLRIVDEETFGPSASLYVVDTDEEAIRLANRSAFGLNAAIHTADLERGMRLGRQLEYGQVHLNWETVYVSPTGPQGGLKASGWGRQNALWGLEEFLEEKSITWHGK
ncbi:aldehyde dehydrogenase [Aspergillus saccharolyticus JOP 1030-1]|uniref:Aldehyde dehydrogenase n=1 Tax=Aspergillus saccharolyticus JOP 1030-1 TaxID=1450539 RepID=A0A318Z0M8_9EURO|nr:aldehyde dehydrogenase [Aspergillus saccharolyticus JOP 1030-1]PYH40469.1 aldehyde dehydrogenase [Aspergillus saccharolyticus JOP 1030-1]